jgi:hypothetical protein
MIEQGPASEDDVVLAFVQAEIDSPKWGPSYRAALQAHGWARADLIDAADLSDLQANRNRRALLGDVRGFGRGTGLFQGFPSDAAWRRVSIELPDIQRLKYINHDADWLELSGGTRLVQVAARNLQINRRIAANVCRTRREIEQGRCTVALILVKASNDELVVLEGHTRATAYAVLADRPFTAFIGMSSLMNRKRRSAPTLPHAS